MKKIPPRWRIFEHGMYMISRRARLRWARNAPLTTVTLGEKARRDAAQTWVSHPEFYQLIFGCLNETD